VIDSTTLYKVQSGRGNKAKSLSGKDIDTTLAIEVARVRFMDEQQALPSYFEAGQDTTYTF
jgi:hypothetical protein